MERRRLSAVRRPAGGAGGERKVATEQETPQSFSDGADGSNMKLELLKLSENDLLKSVKGSTCEL